METATTTDRPAVVRLPERLRVTGLWESVESIEDVPAGERLDYLMNLPPGGIRYALGNRVRDLLEEDEVTRTAIVAVQSLSLIEAVTDCQATRDEARDTLEAILDGVVDFINEGLGY